MKNSIIPHLLLLTIVAILTTSCNNQTAPANRDSSVVAPIIKINGDTTKSIIQGKQYAEPGAVATDTKGKNLAIETFNNIDISRPGTYGVTYTAVDSNNKRTTVGRIVKVQGENLLKNKNPHINKDNIKYILNGAVFSDDSHIKDGSGSIKLAGQGAEVYSKAVTTPRFHLEKGKRYTLSAYIKMVGAPSGQNIFAKIYPLNNKGETVEILYNIAEPNEWEEVILPYRATESGDYVFCLFIHKYGYSTDGQLIKPDLSNMAESPTIYFDDFSVVESDGIISRELYTEKIPFESNTVKIDKLGNWSVKKDGEWKNIFPRFAYQTWLDGFAENAKRYKEYGFTGYANIDDMAKLKTSLNIGLKYNAIQINQLEKTFIGDVLNAIKEKSIPTTAIIMYHHDNENNEMGHYAYKKSAGEWIDKNDQDPLTKKRARPIFVLNGVGEGLARNLKSSHCNFMDLTGTYVGQDGEATDIRYNPVNTLEFLNKIDKQKAPVTLIQMQSYYNKTFIPMLFKGIIQGGRGLKFWRGGVTHNGSKKDFRENYWAPAIKGEDGVFARVDKMLPIIREPLATNWFAIVSQEQTETIAIGKRDHNGKHYLILANFSDKDQTVHISLGGIYATLARDFFTKQELATVKNGNLSINIGHFNDGYKVLELE